MARSRALSSTMQLVSPVRSIPGPPRHGHAAERGRVVAQLHDLQRSQGWPPVSLAECPRSLRLDSGPDEPHRLVAIWSGLPDYLDLCRGAELLVMLGEASPEPEPVPGFRRRRTW